MKTPKVSFDPITDVPRYVDTGHFQSKLDDKSGYDHISLTQESRTYLAYAGWIGSLSIQRVLSDGAPARTFITTRFRSLSLH